MDFLGTNPNQAAGAAESTMTVAESFRTLQSDLMACIDRCVAAAGEPEVIAGYNSFGPTWSTALAGIAVHGESVGGTALVTVADIANVDFTNLGGYQVAPPPIDPFHPIN
ncbi:hypothetical protein [Glycomyces sp. MUSA5-2]|uniref:hypothetical protein n=1 Tax=Glycomyces sp. MUSA5-2 TaxID=2053002 RepID=UPI00300BD86A